MAARARPGQTIVFRARNASDFDLDPESTYEDPRAGDSQIGTVHPLTGPVRIGGRRAGRRAGRDPARHRAGPVRLHVGKPHRLRLRSRHRGVPGRVAPQPDRGRQRRPARGAHPQRELPRNRHRAARPRAARRDALARGRAAGRRRSRLPAVSDARLPRGGLRPGRLPPGRVPAHPPAARARRQPRHPLSAGRRHGVSALLRRGLRSRHRRPALRAGRRRGCPAPPSRWTPISP